MAVEAKTLFTPLPWQVPPWRDMSPTVLLTGSAGGGKSRVAAEKVHAFCLRYPGATALVVRQSRQSMTSSTIEFMRRSIIGRDPAVRYARSRHRFEYGNGSMLVFGGVKDEEQREAIRSIGGDGGLDIAWIEEANKVGESAYTEIQARLRGRAATWRQIILTTNPDAATHWINMRLIIGGEASVYYSKALDNNHNAADYADRLAKLSGVLGKRLRDGLWVSAENAVYADFDVSVHVIDEMPEGWEKWPKYCSIDFGYTNPFVCQWWTRDPDGKLYLYRELYQTGLKITDAAEKIQRLSKGEVIHWHVADHDAGDRAVLRDYDIATVKADKKIRAGLQKVQARIADRRLFFLSGALVEIDRTLEDRKLPTCTIDEMPGYVWNDTSRHPEARELPVQENDHGLDAMRYFVARMDSGMADGGFSM